MPGQKNFLDEFYDWMIRTGRKPKKRDKPLLTMAPSGAKAKFKLARRMLVDLGYVKATKVKGNGYSYSVWPTKGCKRKYNIKPGEFIKWINNEFPTLEDRQQKQRKAAYVFAAWKFGEYLHWEMKNSNGKPLWTKEQLKFIKEETYPPKPKKFEVPTLPLEKSNALIEYIKGRNITHYTMIYLCRWLGGMRYQEMINAPLDLNGRTLLINFKTGEVTIWGKGEGGLQKERYPTLDPEVKKVLKEYLKYRETLTPASDEDAKYLFLTRFGKKFVDSSRALNDPLKYHARAQGKLSEKEITLVSSHRIGRHGFGTYWGPRIGMKLLKEEMGIEDYRVLEGYVNIGRKQRAAIMKEAKTKDIDNSQPQPQGDKLSMIKELLGDLTKEQKTSLIMELVS